MSPPRPAWARKASTRPRDAACGRFAERVQEGASTRSMMEPNIAGKRSSSSSATDSSTLWMLALTGPSSTTSAPSGAMKRAVRRAAAGAGFGRRCRNARGSRRVTAARSAAFARQERLARQPPVDLEVDAVTAQDRFGALAQRRARARRAEAEVEHRVQLARNHVVGAGAGMDVGNLERRRRKRFVAVIPARRRELGERRRERVDRIARLVRIRDVALHAVHRQSSGQRSAPADADHVAEPFARRRLADDARSRCAGRGGGIPRRRGARRRFAVAFLVAGQQQRERARDAIGCARTNASSASVIAATPDFMSAAPRPYRRPSRIVGSNGALVHASGGPGGTTSVWPRNTSTGAPFAVRRPEIVDVAVAQVLDREAGARTGASRSAAGSRRRPASRDARRISSEVRSSDRSTCRCDSTVTRNSFANALSVNPSRHVAVRGHDQRPPHQCRIFLDQQRPLGIAAAASCRASGRLRQVIDAAVDELLPAADRVRALLQRSPPRSDARGSRRTRARPCAGRASCAPSGRCRRCRGRRAFVRHRASLLRSGCAAIH